MSTYFGYLLAGLGGGAVVASLALGLVLTHRSSGVVNFAHAAVGMYVAYAYFEFRETGDVVFPILGLPSRVHLLPRPTLVTALVFAVLLATCIGAALYSLVFRPLRNEPPLARVVASLGVLLYTQEMVRLRFPIAGSGVVRRRGVLPSRPLHLLGTTVTSNRLLLAALAISAAIVLGLVFRYTRYGLATRAAATNEKGALLVGISPDRMGVLSWAVATALGGIAVILIEPIAGLNPTTTPLLVVPALAAALLGRLESFAITTATGLTIGAVQSLVLGWAVRPDTTWLPAWLPTTGLQQAVPVIVIVAVLVARSDTLPDRASVTPRRLPASPTPRNVIFWTLALGVPTAAALWSTDSTGRHAITISLIAALLSLSVVVATGYVGQISLAALALAGIAGFSSIRMVDAGVPFVVALVVAPALAAALGVIVAWPATRVRGMSLGIVTLAIAVAVEQLVLASTAFSGGAAGLAAPRPNIFGWDMGVGALGDRNFRPEFGLVCLVVLAAAAAGVANLRRNRTGLRWLAVRANERAAAAAGIDVARTKLGALAVSSFVAGTAGVLTAFSVTTLSPNSFMVIGSLVAVALTYLAGVSSIGGALTAGLLAQGGLLTLLGGGHGSSTGDNSILAMSGVALVVSAIVAPAGITGAVRKGVWRLRRRAGLASGAPRATPRQAA